MGTHEHLPTSRTVPFAQDSLASPQLVQRFPVQGIAHWHWHSWLSSFPPLSQSSSVRPHSAHEGPVQGSSHCTQRHDDLQGTPPCLQWYLLISQSPQILPPHGASHCSHLQRSWFNLPPFQQESSPLLHSEHNAPPHGDLQFMEQVQELSSSCAPCWQSDCSSKHFLHRSPPQLSPHFSHTHFSLFNLPPLEHSWMGHV